MSCIPASHSMNSVLGQVESEVAERTDDRRGSKSYQIFPETNLNEESDPSLYAEELLFRRERLPSIVVEPTEHSELTNREHSWPAQLQQGNAMEEEEEEVEDSGAEASGSSADVEQQDDSSSVSRKSSIGPSQSQLSLSRLTPPASPTPPEAAPPCLRS